MSGEGRRTVSYADELRSGPERKAASELGRGSDGASAQGSVRARMASEPRQPCAQNASGIGGFERAAKGLD